MTRRRLLKLLGAAGAAGGLGTVFAIRRANAYYAGPVTDHFDGMLFFNPDGTGPKGAWELLKWQFWEARARWPETFPSPHPFDAPPKHVSRDEVRVSSKSRDDLQAVQTLLKGADLDFAVQFVNYR